MRGKVTADAALGMRRVWVRCVTVTLGGPATDLGSYN